MLVCLYEELSLFDVFITPIKMCKKISKEKCQEPCNPNQIQLEKGSVPLKGKCTFYFALTLSLLHA